VTVLVAQRLYGQIPSSTAGAGNKQPDGSHLGLESCVSFVKIVSTARFHALQNSAHQAITSIPNRFSSFDIPNMIKV
jgi:hypothetical protein